MCCNTFKGVTPIRIIVGISGASGAIYGARILEALKRAEVETHLVLSKWAEVTLETETRYTAEELKALADYTYSEDDLYAAISSGSFKNEGMVIAPCSMKTLSGIANGYTENLLVRAADVAIKEHRRLVLLVRETPLNPIHLENMLKLSRLGVTIMPPVPAFYCKPETIDELVEQTVGRALDQFGIEVSSLKRWSGKK